MWQTSHSKFRRTEDALLEVWRIISIRRTLDFAFSAEAWLVKIQATAIEHGEPVVCSSRLRIRSDSVYFQSHMAVLLPDKMWLPFSAQSLRHFNGPKWELALIWLPIATYRGATSYQTLGWLTSFFNRNRLVVLDIRKVSRCWLSRITEWLEHGKHAT
jgi:hypothetical protein